MNVLFRSYVLTILRGCETSDFFKGSTEARFRRKTTGVADILLTESGGLKKIFCSIDACLYHVFMRRKAGSFFKEPTEVERAQRCQSGALLEEELLRQMLRDIGDGVVKDTTSAHIGTVLVSGEQ